jgi:malate dehydrogenase
MSTIGIVGAGELGGAVAHALARRDRVSRIVLFDAAGSVAAGKALDIKQAGAVESFHARLEGTSEIDRLIGCAVCVVADQAGKGEWSGEDALTAMSALARQLGSAPIVFAGTQAAPLLRALVRESGVPRHRVLGSALEALAAAARAIVALEARCSPAEVGLAILGAPPAGFVVPWGEASVGGYALERILTQVQLTRVEQRVARLWPPGPFALGLAAATVVEALVTSSRRTYSVLTVLDGAYGVRGGVGAVPVLLSASGIVHERKPVLRGREQVRLENSIT